MLNGGPVSWCSKRQSTVALSSTEAEYIALTLAAKEATWIRLLLTELGLLDPNEQHARIKIIGSNSCAKAIEGDVGIARGGEQMEQKQMGQTIPLKGDNQSSISLVHNPVYHARTKHIDIQHHYIRDEVAAKRIELSYVPTAEMIADGLTKPLTHVKFHGFVQQMHMN